MPEMLVCDALLDQNVFAGVGNIIKNEVLFRIRLHPLSKVGALPPKKLRQLVDEARRYSFDFLEWKRAFVLRKHWLAHTKRTCPRCRIPFVKAPSRPDASGAASSASAASAVTASRHRDSAPPGAGRSARSFVQSGTDGAPLKLPGAAPITPLSARAVPARPRAP